MARFNRLYTNKLYMPDGKKKGQHGKMTLVTASASEINKLDGITATTDEINAVCDKSTAAVISLTGNTTLTQATHAGKIIILNKNSGFTLTLPEATGTGDVYTFITGTALTSNSYIIKAVDAANTDLVGIARGQDQDDDTVTNFAAIQADGFDKITLNATTTGGKYPFNDRIVLTDVATDVWRVDMDFLCATGSNPATPFSSS